MVVWQQLPPKTTTFLRRTHFTNNRAPIFRFLMLCVCQAYIQPLTQSFRNCTLVRISNIFDKSVEIALLALTHSLTQVALMMSRHQDRIVCYASVGPSEHLLPWTPSCVAGRSCRMVRMQAAVTRYKTAASLLYTYYKWKTAAKSLADIIQIKARFTCSMKLHFLYE